MRKIALALITLLAPATARAQHFDFYVNGPYRSDVPRPSARRLTWPRSWTLLERECP